MVLWKGSNGKKIKEKLIKKCKIHFTYAKRVVKAKTTTTTILYTYTKLQNDKQNE